MNKFKTERKLKNLLNLMITGKSKKEKECSKSLKVNTEKVNKRNGLSL